MKKRWMFIPAGAIFLIALILGSFFDLQLSQSIADTENMFGIVLAAIGEITAYGLIGFLGGCFFYFGAHVYKKTIFKIIFIALGVIALLGATYFQGTAFTSVNAFGHLNESFDKLYFSLPIGFVMVAPFSVAGYFVAKKNLSLDSIKVLFTLLAMVLIVLLGINLIKILAYRPRFRLIQLEGDDLFKNWWEFTFGKGLKDVYDSEHIKSFPSGHTGCAVFAMTIVYLPYFFPQLNKYKHFEEFAFFSGLAYALLIAFSRILVGAHFLSDVAFSGVFFVVTMYVANEVLLKLETKKVNQSTESINL